MKSGFVVGLFCDVCEIGIPNLVSLSLRVICVFVGRETGLWVTPAHGRASALRDTCTWTDQFS